MLIINDDEYTKISDGFINLTDETLHLYEMATGIIWTFPPSTEKLPASPDSESKSSKIYYILDQAEIEEVRQRGRSLTDIVFVDQKLHGRNHVQIAYLKWAENSESNVIFRRRNTSSFNNTTK